MAQVKVVNDNKYVYQERFKDMNISIEPGQHIMMEEDEALQFLGRFPPQGIPVDADGNPHPRGFKKLHIEKGASGVETSSKPAMQLICQRCKYSAANAADLDEHITANHLSDLIDEDERTKRRKQ